ncbi:MAG: hypothetical protein V4616_03235 [Bacteroidota bacterium]
MLNLHRLTVKVAILLLSGTVLLSGCKKKEEFNEIYELDAFNALPGSNGKIKVKTDEQWISVLYANLFQRAISTKLLNEMINSIYSVGDKEVAHEKIIAKFMVTPGLKIPSNAEMRQDIDGFLNDTYKRFFVRNISAAEKAWFKDYIEKTPEVTVEFIFTAFALSNEYQFY